FLLPGAIFEKELNSEMQSRVLEADLLYMVNWSGTQPVYSFVVYLQRDGSVVQYNFASLVFKSKKDQDWLRKMFTMLSGDMLEDSWAYQEMTAEA
ncbi:MAG TPA: hypothetical protein VIZ18_15750, partial [Ktedonobacteraceae bacterium]